MSKFTDQRARSTARSREEIASEMSRLNQLIHLSETTTKGEQSDSDKSKLADLYNERGHMKYLQVDFTGAVMDFSLAINLRPSLAVSYYNRGLIHYRLARFEKAISDMEETLQIDPEFKSAEDCLCQAKIDRDNRKITSA